MVCIIFLFVPYLKNFFDFRERQRKERESERHQFVVLLIYAFIGWFFYVPWPGIEPTTLHIRMILQPTELHSQGLLHTYFIYIVECLFLCLLKKFLNYLKDRMEFLKLLGHRWQTQDPWAESGPPPCFIRPCTLFLPGGSAELSLNC